MELDDFSFMERDLTEVERVHMKILQQITPELFSEFLTAKNTKQFCLSCGHLQLFVPHTTIHKVDPDSPEHTDADDWSYVTPNHKDNEAISVYDARYEVTCSHCGFTSLYSAYYVARWAKEKGLISAGNL
ncbi:hypothetical protein [Klebsiella michiganensis]|uniref:hypothetical protein n=1 Tax=Klebsiella michiganensis TaxID=1134687 RepID=UPI003DA0A5AF